MSVKWKKEKVFDAMANKLPSIKTISQSSLLLEKTMVEDMVKFYLDEKIGLDLGEVKYINCQFLSNGNLNVTIIDQDDNQIIKNNY